MLIVAVFWAGHLLLGHGHQAAQEEMLYLVERQGAHGDERTVPRH
jgi:hypothetical protein